MEGEQSIERVIRNIGEGLGFSWEPACSSRAMLAKIGGEIELLRRDFVALEAEHETLKDRDRDLRANARVLVENLRDAWWVKATDALLALEATLRDEPGGDHGDARG